MVSRTSFSKKMPKRIPRRIPRRNGISLVRYKFILREEWKLITLVSIFLSGVIIGCITVKHIDTNINTKLVTMLTDFVMLRNTNSILNTFINSFSVSFLYLFIAYLFGLCAIGIPIVATIPLCRGIGLGIIGGYFYSTYSLSGAGYCIVIIFPAAIISTVALLYGCNESLVMSHDVFLSSKGKIPNQYENIFKRYNLRYLILTCFIAFSSVVDAIFSFLFANKFTLT